MKKFEHFTQLDEKHFFVDFVDEQFKNGWPRVSAASRASIITDRAAIELAYEQYGVNLDGYRLSLPSKNPDHYKRSGALLHSLYKACSSKKIITLDWPEDIERLRDNDRVGVSFADAEYWNDFTNYYEEYCNEMMSFDLSFRCCDAHEQANNTYDKDYLDNICYYMKENTNLNVGSCVMIFKSFMKNPTA